MPTNFSANSSANVFLANVSALFLQGFRFNPPNSPPKLSAFLQLQNFDQKKKHADFLLMMETNVSKFSILTSFYPLITSFLTSAQPAISNHGLETTVYHGVHNDYSQLSYFWELIRVTVTVVIFPVINYITVMSPLQL